MICVCLFQIDAIQYEGYANITVIAYCTAGHRTVGITCCKAVWQIPLLSITCHLFKN